jgi:hypothetical protein
VALDSAAHAECVKHSIPVLQRFSEEKEEDHAEGASAVERQLARLRQVAEALQVAGELLWDGCAA